MEQINDENKLILGCHVQMRKTNQYLIGSVNEALSYGANTFMLYTASPRIINNKPQIADLNLVEFDLILKQNQINKNYLIVHASYLINLANTIKDSVYKMSLKILEDEINRAIAIGIKILVLHPGSAVQGDKQAALAQFIKGLNIVLKPEHNIKIALETMSGKGKEIGSNFDELNFLLNGIKLKHKVGFCFDTCHLNDAGYDIKNNLEKVLEEFDQKIGLEKIFVIHLNDSKNVLGSKKDRHANIGYGTIGFKALTAIAYHPKFIHIPKILETPYVNNMPPYKLEISNIKNKKFISF